MLLYGLLNKNRQVLPSTVCARSDNSLACFKTENMSFYSQQIEHRLLRWDSVPSTQSLLLNKASFTLHWRRYFNKKSQTLT